MAYRLVVDRSDGPTDVLDVSGLRARLAGITPRTTAVITVQAFSPGGYFGQVARTTVRSPLG
jgi:hypothetical protein